MFEGVKKKLSLILSQLRGWRLCGIYENLAVHLILAQWESVIWRWNWPFLRRCLGEGKSWGYSIYIECERRIGFVEFKVLCSRFNVQCSVFKVTCYLFRVQGCVFKVLCSRVQGSVFKVEMFGV